MTRRWHMQSLYTSEERNMRTLAQKIVKARITALPRSLDDPLPEVWVLLEGEDTEQLLFKYYPDEIRFEPSEFVGLTIDEALTLKGRKDRAFLRSDS